jgi:radical SAM protein with 4Fe4S-binding SPASM domain
VVSGRLGGLVARLRSVAAGGADGPSVGLHAFRFAAGGGATRLQLRVEADGRGLLFVDANDVVRLSATATELAWQALREVPAAQAVAALARRFRGVTRAALREDFARVERIVRLLADPTRSCRTCAAELERTAPFGERPTAPYKADLALTYACENRCPHCYNEPSRVAVPPLGLPGFREVLDRLAALGVPHVVFTGGEPTAHPGLVELVRHAERLGLVAGLNTNGRRLARPGFAEELAASGLDHLQVTFASHDPAVHDAMAGAAAHAETTAGIRRAVAAGLHVSTNTTLTRVNVAGIEETFACLAALGVRTVAANAVIRAGGGVHNPDALTVAELGPRLVCARDAARALGLRFLWYTVTRYCELSPLELELGPRRCNAGEYSMCVEPDGAVLPCQSWYEPAGHLLRDPWEAIWDGPLFRSFRCRGAAPRAAGLPERCGTCLDFEVCGGGCRLDRESRAPARAACGLRGSGRPARPGDAAGVEAATC